MSSDDTGYAPRSPDLSSFYLADPTPRKQQAYQDHQQPPTPSQFCIPGSGPALHFQPTDSSPTASGYHSPGSVPEPVPAANLGATYSPPVGVAASQSQPYIYAPASETQVVQGAPQIQQPYYYQAYGDNTTSPLASNKEPYPPTSGPSITVDTTFYTHPRSDPSPSDTGNMPPRRNAAAAAAASQSPEIEPSPVRTKFPTARIKRIMQADEEVGKVAQQTPIAVGKALELFMVNLVTKSAEVAREKSSKRVSAQMLKQVVESDDQWDFLRDIVSKVENEEKASKGGRAAKTESESDDEVVSEKKKGRPGRKKKAP